MFIMNTNSKCKITTDSFPKLELSDEDLDGLYTWVDQIPLSRPKKNFARDFSDAVSCAEILSFFMPKEVDMIYYMSSFSSSQKKANWKMLNNKGLSKIGIRLSETTINQLVDAKPGVIEQLIWEIRNKLPNPDPSKVKPKRSVSQLMSNSNFTKILRPTMSTPLGLKPMKVKVLDYPDENANYIVDTAEPIIKKLKPKVVASEVMKNRVTEAVKEKTRGRVQSVNKFAERTRIPTRGQSVPCTTTLPPRKKNLIGEIPNDQPIVNYGGVKMIPVSLLEDKEEKRKKLEVENKDLEAKLQRLERLLDVKDQRAEDLTNQLHELHNIYERAINSRESIFAGEVGDKEQ